MNTVTTGNNGTNDHPPYSYCYKCGGYHYGDCTAYYYPYAPTPPTTVPLAPDWWQYQHPTPQYGWTCPKCGAVWAPWVAECQNCRLVKVAIDTTTGSAGSTADPNIKVVLCEDGSANDAR